MKVAFWGNFGTQNLGNECTLHAMLTNTRRHLPKAELVGICYDPADTERRHQIDALPISREVSPGVARLPRGLRQVLHLVAEPKEWVRAVRAMREIEMLVVTGTGILADANQGMLGIPYQMFKWAAAARLCGRRVAFVSVGAEQLTDATKLRFMGWALRLAFYRSYRDPLSKARAGRLAEIALQDPIYPDLAFSLPQIVTGGSSDRSVGGKRVAVGIYAVEDGPEAVKAYVEAVGTFTLWLLDHGYRPRIVIGDVEHDEGVRQLLRSWLAERNAIERVLDEPVQSFEALMFQLAEADLVVATRFHNVLLSLLLGKPVLSVSHMDKNDELMSSMGLSSYCMPLGRLRAEDLVARFTELERNASTLRETIEEKREVFRGKLEEQYAALFGEFPSAS